MLRFNFNSTVPKLRSIIYKPFKLLSTITTSTTTASTPLSSPNIISFLSASNLIDNVTADLSLLQSNFTNTQSIYSGFDPTSNSLHLGGATGMIGDPSGRSLERNLLDNVQLEKNVAGITENINRIFNNMKLFNNNNKKDIKEPIILNNYSWTKDLTVIDFLRDIGKFFRVGPMIGKDSVKNRLHNGDGLSFTEFSYSLLQSNDFSYLNKHFNCSMQIGGSDQFGNITTGIELVRKRDNKHVNGLTIPLLTTKSGEKMGKTASGPIWLDPIKTSAYEFYQYLLNLDDDLAIKLIGFDCDIHSNEELSQLIEDHNKDRGLRILQKRLAYNLTKLVHGPIVDEVRKASDVLFGKGEFSSISASNWPTFLSTMPNTHRMKRDELKNGIDLIQLALRLKAIDSVKLGESLIKQGGFYINKERVLNNILLTNNNLISDYFIVFRTGKKHQHIIIVED